MKQTYSLVYAGIHVYLHLLSPPYIQAPIYWLVQVPTEDEISKRIPAITDKMLAQQLRELESDNLIIKKIYPVIPPKTEYNLSELGKTLIPLLDSMCEWGQQFMEDH